ncbi:single-stranded-DNA-specific exonuclease RecJ [Mucisphaera sp.]|uniref:single-stranded-DNA-specific exonuclease RecJ n=1 Tax=Mucisphaera sp. TaxID=2913024 RepID=UPI003D0DB0C9
MTTAILDARKRWRYRTREANHPDLEQELIRQAGLHPLVASLLVRRGVENAEQANRFLHPRLTDLHDPALLAGAEEAADRLSRAIRDHRSIVIYGDYDVDGVTASAILWHMIRQLGGQAHTYIPHRLEEGYGLNAEALAGLARSHASDAGPPLIVSVDCGITAVEAVAAGKQAGAEIIITDHHGFDEQALPDADTLVHPGLPNLQGKPYPWRDLCGAGVALKVAWALARTHTAQPRLQPELRELMLDLVSLAALGTVADVVPLLDENRVLTSIGLRHIKRTRFDGLTAMIRAAGLDKDNVNTHHVGFVLGPRLNACGRMGHAGDALRLLTDAEQNEVEVIAEQLTAVNNQRRTTEKQILEQAKAQIKTENWASDDKRALVILGDDWHPGVLGIVASRLVETYGRPTIVLTKDAEGHATGSARSVDGVSILDGLHACADCFVRFGGHDMAAGMTLNADRVPELRERLVAFVNEHLQTDELKPTLSIDQTLELTACQQTICEQIDQLAPFGRGNPTPRWTFENLVIDDAPRQIGRDGSHLALRLADLASRQRIRAVAWRMGDLANHLATGVRVDIAGVPKLSTWQGVTRVEIEIDDLRVRAADDTAAI